ncbi:MAG: YqeG family HAD IIIA-type phosphatase [Phormidesmis sp.]
MKKIFGSRLKGFPQTVELLADIDLAALQKAGILGIILDLDNTIISEDDQWVSSDAFNWIDKAKHKNFNLFILSNGRRHHRVKHWSDYFDIPALSLARKPIPCSFYKALNKMRLRSNQVIVIGDSFHTDVIGAWLSGCPVIQVASLPHPPRIWEKYVGHLIHRPYPGNRPLLPLNPGAHLQNR